MNYLSHSTVFFFRELAMQPAFSARICKIIIRVRGMHRRWLYDRKNKPFCFEIPNAIIAFALVAEFVKTNRLDHFSGSVYFRDLISD